MSSYLITGASRGLGYGFIQVLSQNPSNTIIALVRSKADMLQKLATNSMNNVHVVTADITDADAVANAARETEEILSKKGLEGLDVLINNGAYISQSTAWSTLADYETDTAPLLEDMQRSLETNVYGVLKTVYAFLPLIRRGDLKKVITISSGMGDIDFVNETTLAVAAPYTVSKAALSLLFAKLGAAYGSEGILFMSVCPGFVDTDGTKTPESPCIAAKMAVAVEKLDKYTGGNLKMMTPSESATKVLAYIESSSLQRGYSGSFRSHNGTRRWM